MGAMNGYEIRLQLMHEAKDTLMQEWHHRCEVEQASAKHEQRPPVVIPAPDVSEIVKLAEALYVFIQKRD